MANMEAAQANKADANTTSDPRVAASTSNPGSATKVAVGGGKHVMGTIQGKAPAESGVTFSGR